MQHGQIREIELMGSSGRGRVISSTVCQARADAAEIDASEAVTEGQQQRHEESRKNWQRLADQARQLERGQDE